jgi:hypothetical protein
MKNQIIREALSLNMTKRFHIECNATKTIKLQFKNAKNNGCLDNICTPHAPVNLKLLTNS